MQTIIAETENYRIYKTDFPDELFINEKVEQGKTQSFYFNQENICELLTLFYIGKQEIDKLKRKVNNENKF